MREHGITQPAYNVTGDLEFVTVYTLFDITKTGVLKRYNPEIPAFLDDADQLVNSASTWERSRNQQRNLETFAQLIGLRAQPVLLEAPKTHLAVNALDWGFTGLEDPLQTVWSLSFATEHALVFQRDGDATGRLKQEWHLIPMITGLTETANIANPVIQTTGININTVFAVATNVNQPYVAV